MPDKATPQIFYSTTLSFVLIVLIGAYFFKPKPNDSMISVLPKESYVEKRTRRAFQDVSDDVAFAISERNFRVTNTLTIGNAVRLRGNENFPENNVILFCNIHYAEIMLSIDPNYVNFCPGQFAVRQEGEEVVISAPLYPLSGHNQELDDTVNEINQLIIESIDFAAESWKE